MSELFMLNLSLGLRSPAPGLLGTDLDTPRTLPSIAETQIINHHEFKTVKEGHD